MEKAFFEEINGKQVFCVLSQPQFPSKKMVIMSHGFRGNSTGPSRSFVNFKDILVSEGFNVFRFDQTNSGNSEGRFIDSSFNEWVQTIVYFVRKYLDEGYEIVLLGQSMGATATVIASARDEIKDKIVAIMLWVPDPKSDSPDWLSKKVSTKKYQDNIFEEGGQKYKGNFWQEVKDADFFTCLNEYKGPIHLVYGQEDMFVSEKLRKKVADAVKNKEQQVMILGGQDHSGWDYDVCQEVYKTELEFIKKYLR
jgi:hypothetical protein